MPRRFSCMLVFFAWALCCAITLDAQVLPVEKRKVATYNYDFVRGENVVFFDDFNRYEDSTKPYRWNILDETREHPLDMATRAFVKRIDSFNALYFKYGNGNLAQPIWDTAGYTEKYNKNYWSIEFDFKLIVTHNNSGQCIDVRIGDTPNVQMIDFMRWWGDGYVSKDLHEEEYEMSSYVERRRQNYYHTERVAYPVKFNLAAWHHFALALSPRAITGYVDRCKFVTVPGPYNYLPSFILGGRACLAIKNFMIARTDSTHRPAQEESIPINTLLTERKLVTHAITFDKNKAEIKEQSTAIIGQLVALLKANPSVRLQINGHTDSDGTPAENIALSLKRAEAIKRKVVALGIVESRLQVKGWGATQPIAPNTTADGMAQNRRVEFVRL